MTAKRAKPKPNKRKKERRNLKGDERLSLAAASLLVATNVCLVGSFEIFSSNHSEFDVVFRDLLPGLLVACLGISTILTLAVFLVPKRLRHRFVAIFLILGVLLWIEGSFLRWGYGELDGTSIDWAAFSWQGWVDASIWIILLVVAFRFSKNISRHTLFIALTLMILQSGLLVVRVVNGEGETTPSGPGNKKEKRSKIVPQSMCLLSNSRNVFHFIMDAFQTEVFTELVEEEKLTELLDGFVVYKGNISPGSQTSLSVPALFSTYVYDGSVPESEYFRKTLGASFHSILFQKRYVVNLMPRLTMNSATSTNYFDPPATYAAPYRTRVLRSLTYIVDVSMFRHFPHFIKRLVYNDRNWRLSSIGGGTTASGNSKLITSLSLCNILNGILA